MSGDQDLAVYLAGVQTRFDVPDRPEPFPKAIRDLPSQVERRRAQDAWHAACRLRLVIRIWALFMMLGMLRSRLDDATENAIIRRLPELETLGGVLNMLAEGVQWGEEVAQALPAFDQEHEIKRSPTERHREDNPKEYGAQTVQGLIEAFRRLMRTDAECLHLLEVRKETFQRPWQKVLADLAKLTSIDMDFTGDRPRLDFAKTLTSPEFGSVRGRFQQELHDLVQQLETYPEAVLRRPDQEATKGGRQPRAGRGLPLDVVNQKVINYLKEHPEAKSREIASRIGCSEGQVRSTPAWKEVSRRRSQGAGRRKKIGINIALEQAAEEREKERKRKEQEEEQEDAKPEEPDDPQQQVAKLIAEQQRDQRNDSRPRR